MNKKYIILAVAILGVALIAYLGAKKTDVKAPAIPDPFPTTITTIPTTGAYCFKRDQIATEEAPYSAQEFVVLIFEGTKVTGTKTGTQQGPGVSNGYTGTLEGAVITDDTSSEIELTYAYVVEGSANRELEVYAFYDGKIFKKIWRLNESKINGFPILVPDYVGEPALIEYQATSCED